MKIFTLLPSILTVVVLSLASASAQVVLPTGRVGSAYSAQVATVPDAPADTLYTAEGLPSGLSLAANTGVVSGTPQTAGTYTIKLKLVSSVSTDLFDVSLVIDAASGTPTITSPTSAASAVGANFAYQASATNSPTSFNLSPVPAGLSLDASLGKLSGVPTQAASYALGLSANNAFGTGPLETLMFSVDASTGAPTINESSVILYPSGAAPSYQINASGSPTSYSAVGLPLGLSIDPATGIISGTASTTGVWSVLLTATNANGTSVLTTVYLVVGSLPVVSAPASVTLGLNRASGAIQLSATNSPISYNVKGLPRGLSVDTATGVISGVPTEAGAFTLKLSANNSLGTGPEKTMNLLVTSISYATNNPLLYLSARARVVGSGGDSTYIVGFIVPGSKPHNLVLRALGPGLNGTSVQNWLSNPKLRVFRSDGSLVVENDNWDGSDATKAAMAKAGMSPLATGSKDAALALTLPPGAYTFHIVSVDGSSGVSVAEIYDISDDLDVGNDRFAALACRANVYSGEGVEIGGFVLGGTEARRVLIRGAGPDLLRDGISSALANPAVRVFNSAGQTVAMNDDWEVQNPASVYQESASAAEMAIAMRSCQMRVFNSGSKDAAAIADLPPGAYTVHVSAPSDAAGISVIEIYVIP